MSPRTVSAYFPHKEDLAFPDSDEAFTRLVARAGTVEDPRGRRGSSVVVRVRWRRLGR